METRCPRILESVGSLPGRRPDLVSTLRRRCELTLHSVLVARRAAYPRFPKHLGNVPGSCAATELPLYQLARRSVWSFPRCARQVLRCRRVDAAPSKGKIKDKPNYPHTNTCHQLLKYPANDGSSTDQGISPHYDAGFLTFVSIF